MAAIMGEESSDGNVGGLSGSNIGDKRLKRLKRIKGGEYEVFDGCAFIGGGLLF
jgi:hypothetical protein